MARPKTRHERPSRSAAAKTAEGDEKYIIIASVDRIEKMKEIAAVENLTIKEIYRQAIDARIKRFGSKQRSKQKKDL